MDVLIAEKSSKQSRKAAISDITGQKFYRLTALHPTEKRDAKGYVIWHCRCDCGNEVDVPYNSLMYSNTIRSCGCRKREHEQQLGNFLKRVDGTSVDMLKSKKVPKNNTTGVKGVYFIKGKYVAKIVFQKKQYVLGSFDDLESAAAARKEAETQLNDTVVAYYDRWSARAAQNAEWGEHNPMRITVERDGRHGLHVVCLPELEP